MTLTATDSSWKKLLGTTAPGPAQFVRVIVGWVFLSEGIQ
jgi:hypothetical protein